MMTIPNTTAESPPTVLTDVPIKNGNSLPAFPVRKPSRGLSATLGTDLPIPLPPVAPVRQVSAQIFDVQEEDETLSFYDSFLDEDDDESRLQGIEDE
jgi:hypothetical protein